MLSQKYSHLLSGIEQADSVSISAHKWFFQPKESALILFKNNALASKAISFGGAYLASPNIGVLGSRSANAIPLLATFLAWGKQGMAARIDATMELIESLQSRLQQRNEVSMYQPNSTGVILWRVENNAKTLSVFEQLPQGAASTTNIDECLWIRQVGANPNVNIDKLWKKIERVLDDILSNTDS
jgi:L-2,4-diaminobutyrate decarboxylase